MSLAGTLGRLVDRPCGERSLFLLAGLSAAIVLVYGGVCYGDVQSDVCTSITTTSELVMIVLGSVGVCFLGCGYRRRSRGWRRDLYETV